MGRKRRLTYGRYYRVVEGSGLDSGRVGCLVRPAAVWSQIRNELGRYKPFDGRREVALIDENGEVFTMFKNRLEEVA